MKNFLILTNEEMEVVEGGSVAGVIIGGVSIAAGVVAAVATAPVVVPVATGVSIIAGFVSLADSLYDCTRR